MYFGNISSYTNGREVHKNPSGNIVKMGGSDHMVCHRGLGCIHCFPIVYQRCMKLVV
jgi:hypothetical protein